MKKQRDKILNPAELRQQAEQQMHSQSHGVIDLLMTDQKKLMHELQVHQLELKMQNEALHDALTKNVDACVAAKREHERYLELFDFAPVAYLTLEENHIIRKGNICAATLLGFEQSQIVGHDFTWYVSYDYRPAFIHFLSNIFAAGNRQQTEIALQIGEKLVWVTIDAIVDKLHKTCFMAITDISARKQSEDLLRENNAFIASILNSMSQQIAVLDRQGVIIGVNDAWIDFGKKNGLSARWQNMLGSNYLDACKNESGHFLCEDAHDAYCGIQAVLNGERNQFFMEYPCHFNDQQCWLQMTVSPLLGQQYGAVISHEDITQRKKAERLPNIIKTMFDVSMDGYWELDAEGKFLSANERYKVDPTVQTNYYSV